MLLRNIDIQAAARAGSKFLTDNSPLVLTAFGVAGVATTAWLTGKASFKAAHLILEDYGTHPTISGDKTRFVHKKGVTRERTKRDDFELVWKLYLPAAGVGSFTIASIIMANRVGTRRAAAMASAFAISEKAIAEYKDKVVETIGANKEMKIRDEIAQDRVTANPPASVFVTGGGNVLFMDAYSGRPFMSSMETLKKAQNDLNYQVINHNYASLTEFYSKIGLPSIKSSDEVGWNSDKLLELTFSTTMTEKDEPCIVVDFNVAPIRNYFRVNG